MLKPKLKKLSSRNKTEKSKAKQRQSANDVQKLLLDTHDIPETISIESWEYMNSDEDFQYGIK